jgi:hypothetical protein
MISVLWAEIHLTRGEKAIVDVEDIDSLKKHRWYCDSCNRGKKYAARQIMNRGKRTTIRMHEFLMGKKSGYEIDHINGNGLDNRRSNLRFVSHSTNCLNNFHYAKSVYFDKSKKVFIARVLSCGVLFSLGSFPSESLALKKSNLFKRNLMRLIERIYSKKGGVK